MSDYIELVIREDVEHGYSGELTSDSGFEAQALGQDYEEIAAVLLQLYREFKRRRAN